MSIQEAEIVPQTEVNPVSPKETSVNKESEKCAEAPKPSPAKDLRDVQNLLVQGIFPGNMAPSVVRAYQLLEAMAKQVESANDKKDPA